MGNHELRADVNTLILCEGVDAKYFLIWLFDYYIKKGHTELEKIQIEDFGGIKQLSTAIAMWKNISGFNKITSLCIIRDAETDFSGSCQSIKYSIQKNGFESPEKAYIIKKDKNLNTLFILFPFIKNEDNDFKSGTLEDLCLEIINDKYKNEKLNDIENFINDCKGKYNLSYPRMHKTRLHEYFVMHDKFVDSKIGEAAKAGCFDFEHPVIKEMIKLIMQLVS